MIENTFNKNEQFYWCNLLYLFIEVFEKKSNKATFLTLHMLIDVWRGIKT
jgi:hypothetical protein